MKEWRKGVNGSGTWGNVLKGGLAKRAVSRGGGLTAQHAKLGTGVLIPQDGEANIRQSSSQGRVKAAETPPSSFRRVRDALKSRI